MTGNALEGKVASYEKQMVDTMSKMISIKSISPAAGGEGEGKRADFLQKTMESLGFKADRYEYVDESKTKRPNLVVKFGNMDRTIWIVSHIDTVSEGDIALWKTDPFKAVVKDGKIYGRGTSDDGQSAISSIYALLALKETKAKMKYNFGLVLVADEELGSHYGIQKLLEEKGLFDRKDLFIVPDSGSPDGRDIEVAEKSIVWLKITVHGKQVHGSTPEKGVNAYRYAIRFLSKADEMLHRKYNKLNKLFDPPGSTFEMTKHEKNTDSINIVPGTEVSYMDCRVLPEYNLEDVINDIEGIAREPEFKPVKIEFDFAQHEKAAPPTDEKSEIVVLLKRVLKAQRGIEPRAIGIGGGTCAAYFRRKGYDSVVWETVEDVPHQPNEFCVIKNMVDDAKTFAALFV